MHTVRHAGACYSLQGTIGSVLSESSIEEEIAHTEMSDVYQNLKKKEKKKVKKPTKLPNAEMLFIQSCGDVLDRHRAALKG